jgi:dTDP-glucose 4,6-dehydratase
MIEKFVVIGSNSFSGASFVEYLLEQGTEVIGISRSPEPHQVFLPYKWKGSLSSFRFYALDLNHHLDDIMSVVHEFKPDYVVNFASQGMVAQSWQHPEHWFMTNVVSTIKLHDRLRHCDFLKKYVHISTPEVYGNCQGYITEEAPYNPTTPYAVSRAAADMSLKTFVAAYHFPAVSTRAANVFGPGQQLYRIIPRTILFIKLGKKLPLHGGGHSIRSFIHIRDVAAGTLQIARHAPAGEIYHLSTRQTLSIKDLVEKICQRMGVDFAKCVEISEERLGKDYAYFLDSGKIRNTLGWADKISLEQGIEETIQWVEQNFEVLKTQPFEYIHKP